MTNQPERKPAVSAPSKEAIEAAYEKFCAEDRGTFKGSIVVALQAAYAIDFAALRSSHEALEKEVNDWKHVNDVARDCMETLQRSHEALAVALEAYQTDMENNGNWDDGCFYYRGVSASELDYDYGKSKTALQAAAPLRK